MEGSRAAQEANYVSSVSWARYFSSVKGEQLTAWVSSFRPGMTCSVVDYISGTFNLNVHVCFQDNVQWIVRFPVPGRAMGDLDAKVRHEVAVMKLVKSRTAIPVPEIIAWGIAATCPLNLGPFIVMEYVEGKVLGRLLEVPGSLPGGKILRDDVDPTVLDYVYKQVARFTLQLAEVEFPSIGAVSENEGVFSVESGPVTVKMNDIERQDGVSFKAPPKPIQTTTDFFHYTLSHEMEHLRIHPESVTDADDARKKFRRLKNLKSSLPQLVDPAWDAGPFVLRCEGMRFGNMLADENFTITAVLDWEWSYAAPRQMLHSPPRWLIIRRPTHWNTRAPWENGCSARYLQCFDRFIRVLAEEEAIMDRKRVADGRGSGGNRLSRLMSESQRSGILWFHELLLTPSGYGNDSLWAKVEKLLREGDGASEGTNEEEVEEFVEAKMRQVHEFEKKHNTRPEDTGAPRKNLLSISIMEILNTY